jgi:hypothetical protein
VPFPKPFRIAQSCHAWAFVLLGKMPIGATNFLIYEANEPTWLRAPLTLNMVAVALAHSRRLVGTMIKAPLSLSQLSNLEEFIQTWSVWKPHIYERVAIECDQATNDVYQVVKPTAMTFSGGVDASATLIGHKTGTHLAEPFSQARDSSSRRGPRARGTGSIFGCAARIRHFLAIGHYSTATAEHREPYESRGSRTVLGAPGGESPPGDSSCCLRSTRMSRWDA